MEKRKPPWKVCVKPAYSLDFLNAAGYRGIYEYFLGESRFDNENLIQCLCNNMLQKQDVSFKWYPLKISKENVQNSKGKQ